MPLGRVVQGWVACGIAWVTWVMGQHSSLIGTSTLLPLHVAVCDVTWTLIGKVRTQDHNVCWRKRQDGTIPTLTWEVGTHIPCLSSSAIWNVLFEQLAVQSSPLCLGVKGRATWFSRLWSSAEQCQGGADAQCVQDTTIGITLYFALSPATLCGWLQEGPDGFRLLIQHIFWD